MLYVYVDICGNWKLFLSILTSQSDVRIVDLSWHETVSGVCLLSEAGRWYQWNDKVSPGNWGNLKCEILTKSQPPVPALFSPDYSNGTWRTSPVQLSRPSPTTSLVNVSFFTVIFFTTLSKSYSISSKVKINPVRPFNYPFQKNFCKLDNLWNSERTVAWKFMWTSCTELVHYISQASLNLTYSSQFDQSFDL